MGLMKGDTRSLDRSFPIFDHLTCRCPKEHCAACLHELPFGRLGLRLKPKILGGWAVGLRFSGCGALVIPQGAHISIHIIVG